MDEPEPGEYSPAVTREMAIEMLAQGSSLSAVARPLDINRTTLYRWLHDPHFVAELNAAKKECIALAKAKARQLAAQAIDKINNLMENGPEKIQLEAAKYLLHVGEVDKPEEIGSTDPADINHEQRVKTHFYRSDP